MSGYVRRLKTWFNKDKVASLLLTVYFLVSWSWLFLTNSVKLTGTPLMGKILALTALAVEVSISVYLVLKAYRWLNQATKKYNPFVTAALAFPCFALLDFLVSWLTTILWLGPQGSVDSVLPIGSPGLFLIHTPLRYAIRLVGLYGLSAVVWTTIFLAIHPRLRKTVAWFLGAVVLVSFIGWSVYAKPSPSPTVRAKVVNESLGKRIPSVSADDAQLVVFPEYGFDEITSKNLDKRLTASGSPTYFVGSQQIDRFGLVGHINQLVFGNTAEGITYTQAKHRLIPSGEDASYLMRTFLRATGQKPVLDFFSINRQVIKGKTALKPLPINSTLTLGSEICSSVTSPDDYRSVTKQGATVLTNSASLDIFDGSRIFSWQQKSLSMSMAVANARPYLQSANDATSFILDRNGNTIASTQRLGVLEATVQPNSKKTLYTELGDWPLAVGLLIALYELYRHYRPRRRAKK